MADTANIQPNRTVTISSPRGDLAFSNDAPVVFIAGPCALESRDHALKMSEALAVIAERIGAKLVYKTSFDKANRTSASGFRGPGIDDALPIFEEVKSRTGLPVLTDIHTADQCIPAAEVIDVLQIPAFLCRQTDLLLAAAATGRPINVKKGQFLAPWDMKNVVAKLLAGGARDIMLTERGVSFGYNTLVNDMRALPELKKTGCPVVFDATHSVQQPGGQGDASGGQREFAPVLANAAASIGVASVFIEIHDDPDNAPSDGPNMIHLENAEDVMRRIMAFDALAKSFQSEQRS
ncbi:MAG: 3-deoxy-8-phosphooctulonate synthase [Pseudomonadota bacterium]